MRGEFMSLAQILIYQGQNRKFRWLLNGIANWNAEWNDQDKQAGKLGWSYDDHEWASLRIVGHKSARPVQDMQEDFPPRCTSYPPEIMQAREATGLQARNVNDNWGCLWKSGRRGNQVRSADDANVAVTKTTGSDTTDSEWIEALVEAEAEDSLQRK